MLEGKIKDLFFVRTDGYGSYKARQKGKKTEGKNVKKEVTDKLIADHIEGKGQPIGTYTQSEDEGSCLACADYDTAKEAKLGLINGDCKKLEEEKKKLLFEINPVLNVLHEREISFLLEDSTGGYHLWFFFEEVIPQGLAYEFAEAVAPGCPETFPKQKGKRKWGNYVRLPGKYHSTDDYSHVWFWDGKGGWHSTKDKKTWERIAKTPKISRKKAEEVVNEAQQEKRATEDKEKKERQEFIDIKKAARSGIKMETDDRLDAQLREIEMVNVLRDRYGMKPDRSGQYLCKFHNDSNPSGFVVSRHGIEFYCCAGNCKYNVKKGGSGKHVIGLVMQEDGKNFLEACDELGIDPPSLERGCDRCGGTITFMDKKPVNPDGSPHRCANAPEKKRKKNKHFQEVDGKTFFNKIKVDPQTGEVKTEKVQVCNFTMRVMEKIVNDDDEVSWLIALTRNGITRTIEIAGSDLMILQKFCDKVASVGMHLVDNSSKIVHNSFLEYVTDESCTEEKRKTQYVGKQEGQQVFMFTNGLAIPGQVMPLTDLIPPKGILKINMPGNPKKFMEDTIRHFHDAYDKTASRQQLWKALGFAVGALFANDIKDHYGFYPLLFLNGPKGCGKSTLAEFILALFGAHREIKPFNFNSTTKAWNRAAEKYCGIPLVLNEYQAGRKTNATVQAFYDRDPYARAMTTNDLQIKTGAINAAFVLCSTRLITGYESEAVASRLVTLDFDQITRNEASKESIWELKKRKDYMACFVPEALKITPKEIIKEADREIMANSKIEADQRIVDNHSILKACYNLFLEKLGLAENMHVAWIERDILDQQRATEDSNSAVMFLNLMRAMLANGDLPPNIARSEANGAENDALVFSLKGAHPYVKRFAGQATEKDAIPDERTLGKLLEGLGAERKRDRVLGDQKWTWRISLDYDRDDAESTPHEWEKPSESQSEMF